MKVKTQRCTLAAIIIFITPFLSQTFAQNNPSIQNIISKVREATVAKEKYSVNMTQVISKKNKISQNNSGVSENSSNNYEVFFTPGKGYKLDEIKKSNSSPSSTTAKTASTINPKMTISVDLEKLFKTSPDWQNYKITDDTLDNNITYKISAQYRKFNFIFWVDKEKHYVSRIILYIEHKKFSETNIEYKNVGKLWLPADLTILHSDGALVTQNFGEYKF